jgi:hypothetical protein
MPLAPSLALENIFGDTHQIFPLIHLKLEDRILSRQGEVDDVHRNVLLCVVPISTGGNTEWGIRSPGITPGTQSACQNASFSCMCLTGIQPLQFSLPSMKET